MRKIQWLIIALVWSYIIYRAFSFPIEHDEAYSYLLVKTNNLRQMPGTANTHWLNSLFIKLFLWLPGSDLPWKLRMLSVLSWPLYGHSTVRLSRCFESKWLGFVFFAIALLNPYLIFYFSMSRGYAAACTFIMLALWQAASVLQSKETRPDKWLLVFIYAAVAVMANLTSFYVFIALGFAYVSQLALFEKIKLLFRPSAVRWHILMIAVSVFAVTALFIIKYYGRDLTFGGRSNIIGSMIGSLMTQSLYVALPTAVYQGAAAFVFVLLGVSCLYAVYVNVRLRKITITVFSLYLFATIVLLNIIFHVLFDNPYLSDRTALIIYPLLVLCFFKTSDAALLRLKRIAAPVKITAGLLLAFCCYNFYKSYNTRYFYETTVQADTKKCLEYLRAVNARRVGLHYFHLAVFANYYSVAFPGRYRFDYAEIGREEMLYTADTAKFFR